MLRVGDYVVFTEGNFRTHRLRTGRVGRVIEFSSIMDAYKVTFGKGVFGEWWLKPQSLRPADTELLRATLLLCLLV